MYFKFRRAAVIVGMNMLLSGMLFAVTPAELGRDCADNIVTGIVGIIKEGCWDKETKNICKRVQSCVQESFSFDTRAERIEFLKSVLSRFQSLDMKNGVEFAGLPQEDRSRAAFLKYYAIQIIENCVNSFDQHLLEEEQSQHWLGQVIMSGTRKSRENDFALVARVATAANRELFNIEESEEAVVLELNNWQSAPPNPKGFRPEPSGPAAKLFCKFDGWGSLYYILTFIWAIPWNSYRI